MTPFTAYGWPRPLYTQAWLAARRWWLAAGTTRFIHVPIKLVISEGNQVAPDGDL
jgi:hypothetical protein